MANTNQTLNDFLSGVRLTELFNSEAIKTGVPDPFPELNVSSGNNPVGTKVQWAEITGNRRLAQMTNQTAPARVVDQPGIQRRFATALGGREEMMIEPDLLYALKQNVPIIADNARKELVNRATNFRSRFDNTKKAMRASVLANGAIYVDGSGNILPTSSGSGPASVNFNVPTGNLITKNGSGSTYNIGDWSSAATTIPLNLRKLRTANIRLNGYRLSTVYYGQSVVDYLANNTSFQEYLKRNPVFNQRFVDENQIPDGTCGWKWRPVSDAFFDDQNGTTQAWFPDNYIGFAPDVSTEWYEMFDCGTLVPTQIASMAPDIDAAIGLCEVKYGLFSFAKIDQNMNCSQQFGYFGLPTLKVPGTFYFGTCS